MKPTRTISSYILLVGVMGLSIVGGVVAYQIYAASSKSQVTTEQKELIKPIDGTINQKTVEGLKTRTRYTEAQMRVLLSSMPTPAVTEAVLQPTPEATAEPVTETETEATVSATTQ